MAVRKESSFATNKGTNLSKNVLRNAILVGIERSEDTTTWIVNIYEQREGETGERPARRLNCQRIIRQGGGVIVLAGYFHTHSQSWDQRCTEWRHATYWEEIIDKHRLVIGNDDWPTHYWTRQDSMGESVIHQTLPNRLFGKWMILDGSHVTGSGHEIIEWEFEMEMQEDAGVTQVTGWNLVAISQEDVKVAEDLWRECGKEREHLGAQSTGDEVQSEA